jgi:hypothetical protein
MKKRNLPKKELELSLLKDFISNKDLNLKVKAIIEGETPDFVIEELTKNISVELTRLIHADTIQKEAFQEKLVATAQSLFKEKYDEELYVLVTFSDIPIKCSTGEIKTYAEEFFKIVEEMYLPNRNHEFHVSSRCNQHINSYIDRISISNNRDLENWQPFGAFKVNYIDINWIKEVIRGKEKNLYKYRHNLKENWLLLIANFGHESSAHRFDHLKRQQIETEFDKVYLYLYRDKEILQLKSLMPPYE